MPAPIAKTVPFTHVEHGLERPDPWHWIKNRQDPDVIPLLEAENAYVEEELGHRDAFREALYKEMLGRIVEDDASVPVRLGEYWYYSRTEEGAAYAIHARKKGSLDAPEEIVLDENALAEGHAYFSLDQYAVSQDHGSVAWLQDTDGSEHFELLVRDLESGATRSVATGLKWSLAWSADGCFVYGVRGDAAERPCTVLRFNARETSDPVVIFEESDERFFVGVERARDWSHVLIESGSKTTTEVRLIASASPDAPPAVVWPRREGVEYEVCCHPKGHFIRTNAGSGHVNFSVVRLQPGATSGDGDVIVEHDEDIYRTSLLGFRDHLVIWERRDGLPGVRIVDLATDAQHTVDFPDAAYELRAERNPDFEASELRWTYQSMRTPPTVEVYRLDGAARAVLKVTPVRGHQVERYRIARVEAETADGVKVPISLIYRADIELDSGPHPMYLTGYGSYGFSYPASFSSTRLSLVDRGMIVGIAHIRGGAERGRAWYETGKMESKVNTFEDFITAATHLFSLGWTAPDRMVIQGGSAGGLLMGAVMNRAPDLFRAVIADVPFVDALNTMLDATLPLTVTEYEEWGNPNEREVFDRMMEYSPYENIRPVAYPHVYATAGLNDPRVGYWEPAKWVQKLRSVGTGDRPALLRVHLGAGHGGQSGRYGRLQDTAWSFTFALDRLGLID